MADSGWASELTPEHLAMIFMIDLIYFFKPHTYFLFDFDNV